MEILFFLQQNSTSTSSTSSKLKRNWITSKYSLNKPSFNYLSVDKLQESQQIILKLFQNKSFYQEVEVLHKHGTIHRCSQIIFLDRILNDNLLRVGGQPNYNSQRTSSSTTHCKTLSGKQITLWAWVDSIRHDTAILESSYRGIINKFFKQCSYWKRRRAKPRQPFMSNIPSAN